MGLLACILANSQLGFFPWTKNELLIISPVITILEAATGSISDICHFDVNNVVGGTATKNDLIGVGTMPWVKVGLTRGETKPIHIKHIDSWPQVSLYNILCAPCYLPKLKIVSILQQVRNIYDFIGS